MFETKKTYLNIEPIGQQMHSIVPQISDIKLIQYIAILVKWPGGLRNILNGHPYSASTRALFCSLYECIKPLKQY